MLRLDNSRVASHPTRVSPRSAARMRMLLRDRSGEVDRDALATATGICNAALAGILLWIVLFLAVHFVWSAL